MNHTTADARSADALHLAWVQKRDVAVAKLMADRQAQLATWFAIADAADTPSERSTGAALVRLATVAADCADYHVAAADGYFRLAQAMQTGVEPAPTARRWYTLSLARAEQAGNDFYVARSAYCLGTIDEAEGRADDAVAHFTQAREHSERAGNPGGKAAALFQLALLAKAKLEFGDSIQLALQSYLVSREAKQYLSAAETLTMLCELLSLQGLDWLAEVPGLDLLSQAVILVSEQADDAGRVAACTLHALALLNAETRTTILRGISERFDAELAGMLGRELEKAVAAIPRNSE